MMRSPDSGGRRPRALARYSAPLLAGLTALAVVATVPLSLLDGQFGVSLIPGGLSLVFAVTGLVVARREPRNAVGWILLGAGLLIILCTFGASVYLDLDYRRHNGAWPLGWAAVLVGQFWAAPLFLGPLAILLFPDGRLPSPRWRWLVRAYLTATVIVLASQEVIGVDAISSGRVPVDSHGNLISTGPKIFSNPVISVAGTFLVIFMLVCWVGFVGVQVASYRRARGVLRQQLKWVMSGAAVTALSIPVFISIGNQSSIFLRALGFLGIVGLAALPASIGVAILKHGLYEIDRLISRTLSYALLTATLGALFFGSVALTGDVLPFSSPVAVAGSTLVAAMLFNPLRRRVQHVVDRRFNRARYDADAAVAAFAARLRDAVDPDSTRDELLSAVTNSVAPAHASLWIRPRETSLGPTMPAGNRR